VCFTVALWQQDKKDNGGQMSKLSDKVSILIYNAFSRKLNKYFALKIINSTRNSVLGDAEPNRQVTDT